MTDHPAESDMHLHCERCDVRWREVLNMPIELGRFVRRMRTVACPRCHTIDQVQIEATEDAPPEIHIRGTDLLSEESIMELRDRLEKLR